MVDFKPDILDGFFQILYGFIFDIHVGLGFVPGTGDIFDCVAKGEVQGFIKDIVDALNGTVCVVRRMGNGRRQIIGQFITSFPCFKTPAPRYLGRF